MWLQAKRYSGDGIIQTCSSLVGAGYRIDFPEFDASRPYSASYRLSKLPQVFRRDPVIYLKFHLNPDFGIPEETKKRITASFRITLFDSQSHVIRSAELTLADTIWWGGEHPLGAYDLPKSVFHFNWNTPYILQVSYEPGLVPPPATQLYFSIDNCAFY